MPCERPSPVIDSRGRILPRVVCRDARRNISARFVCWSNEEIPRQGSDLERTSTRRPSSLVSTNEIS